MTTIELHTKINAPIEEVFNLSRSIDFHVKSAAKTNEKAIAGVTSGLIGYGETVTWKGKHFGLYLKHTTKITNYQYPERFTDVMIEGHFKYFGHQHFFHSEEGKTTMKDVLRYKTPYGIFGKIFNLLFLKPHLIKFLKNRNSAIKSQLEAKNALLKDQFLGDSLIFVGSK